MGSAVEILLGTANLHKVEEISSILKGEFIIRSLEKGSSFIEPEEIGTTISENAAIKAVYYGDKYNLLTLADDTGLEVEALNGQPGVHTARFAGEHATYEDNNFKLLRAMDAFKSKNKRKAIFKTCIGFYEPNSKKIFFTEGFLEGIIAFEPIGNNGFGYDPIFIPNETYPQTLAQLSKEEKNLISHRGRALKNLVSNLQDWKKKLNL